MSPFTSSLYAGSVLPIPILLDALIYIPFPYVDHAVPALMLTVLPV
jgi:hypothetical protein